ncbi:MAG: 50S ribosomal protein L4 [Acidobacteriota bacterium]|nr:50S ribosomal protein L4 [Acidobacteriota bacterium]
MANVNIVNLAGTKVGEFELDDLFSGEVNETLLWEAVKHYRASIRQGTAATKNRKKVSGAGRKLWKQKGTGRARVGSIRTPLWRGGGTVHGPQPRSYDHPFPKKKLMGALRSAISSKLAAGKLTIVENFDVAEGKTKLYRTALNTLEAKKTTLLVESSQELSEKLYLGSRNLSGVELVLSSEVHPYDLLKYEHAVFSKAAFETLQETLKKSVSKRKHEQAAEKEAA